MLKISEYNLLPEKIDRKKFLNVWITFFDNENDEQLATYLLKNNTNLLEQFNFIFSKFNINLDEEHKVNFDNSFKSNLNNILLNIKYGDPDRSSFFFFNENKIKVIFTAFDDNQTFEAKVKDETERVKNANKKFVDDFLKAYDITKSELDFILDGKPISFPLNYSKNVKLVEEYISIRNS